MSRWSSIFSCTSDTPALHSRLVKTFLLIAALILASTSAFAGGQHVIPDYATAQRNFFWTKLYVNGGRDLYCNVRFIVGQRLTVEHVYAAD